MKNFIDSILKLKHWKIFLMVFLSRLIYLILLEFDKNFITILSSIIFFIIYLSYSTIIGVGLFKYLPQNITFNKKLFIVNGVISTISISILVSISNQGSYEFEGYFKIIGFYLFYAFLSTCLNSVRIIKSIELDKKVKKRECIIDFLLIIFLPLGIWIIQPRVNKIVSNKLPFSIK